MKPPSGEDFLKKKYDLHKAPEVDEQAERTEFLEGEKVPQDPSARISNYLKRFDDILKRQDPHERERGVEALKIVLHRKNVIKPSEIPESYFELQKKIAREQGHGDVEIDSETRGQAAKVIIRDQETSLDRWVDYLASPDAPYPAWLKYWATREMLKMGGYDKEKHAFAKRRKDTIRPFPDLNREALPYVLAAVGKKHGSKVPGTEAPGIDPEFEKLLASESFPKLYAWAIEKVTPASKEQLESVEGEWVKYAQGSDPKPLSGSLEGRGTGWCTAEGSTAKLQLQGGDFHVFYSKDEDGNPVIPRAAIRMEGDKIAEVRGIAEQQNLDPKIAGVVKDKLSEFPDGPAYEKKASDMKILTKIEAKTDKGEPLGKDELKFLYEIDSEIEGFGYSRDPRIKELRDKRDPKEDAPVVFECAPDQIAWNQDEITSSTKAYVGPLFPGVFDALSHLEHLYTSFPEGRIERFKLELGGKTPEEYEAELAMESFEITDRAKDILRKTSTSKEKQETELIRLTVEALGFTAYTRYDEILKRAKELGLDHAPAEAGPALRLSMKEQVMNDDVIVAMEPLADRYVGPSVFFVGRSGGGSWLDAISGRPGGGWHPDDSFVFVPRKQSSVT
ncbi:MAG: hypothetical protein AAB554_00575 [Patescibacteria group bacterium]